MYDCWWQNPAYAHLLYRIILLYKLNQVPERPAKYDLFQDGNTIERSSNRVLSLKHEKDLAEALVYLAAATDDPRKIVALYVEEGAEHECLYIRMAVNNGRLDKVQESFSKLGSILEEVAHGQINHQDAEDTLLVESLRLNQGRILCRLRSRHAVMKCIFPKKKKLQHPPLHDLPDTLQNAALATNNESSGLVQEEIGSCANCIRTHFIALEQMNRQEVLAGQSLPILTELVRGCERLTSFDYYLTTLTAAKNSANALVLSLKVVNKLARYITIAKHLVRSAKRFSLFRKINIQQVKLEPSKVTAVEPDLFTSDAIQTIGSNPQWQRLLSRSNPDTCSDISSYLSTIPYETFPVHAEVQLLVHSELHPRYLTPRIICSSKKACYLCDLFFKKHGKYLISSTHRRLYEKWALPKALQTLPRERKQHMKATLQQLVQEVETKIRHQVLSPQKPYAHPNESVAYSSIVWSQSSHSTIRATSVPSPKTMIEAQQNLSLSPISKHSADYLPPGQHDASNHTGSTSLSNQNGTEAKHVILEKGKPVSKQVRPGLQELRISTPKIDTVLSYDVAIVAENSSRGNSPSEKHTSSPWTTVEWLSDDTPPGPGKTVGIDLDEVPAGLERTIDLGTEAEAQKLRLSRGRDYLEIIFHRASESIDLL